MRNEEKIKEKLKKLKEKNIEKYNFAISTLLDTEKEILQLKFGLIDNKEYTFEEISKRIMPNRPIMKERIRQIFEKALRKVEL